MHINWIWIWIWIRPIIIIIILRFLPPFRSQKKPGLSAYASDPREAAQSLVSLLDEAKRVVPAELRDQTPVRVGVGVTSHQYLIDFLYFVLDDVLTAFILHPCAGHRWAEEFGSSEV